MKRSILIFLLLLAAVGGWFAWKTANPGQRDSAPVFHGNVDIREVRLGFRVGGRVAEVLKEEGDAVASGEIVARLDAEPFQITADQARAKVEQMEAQLQELQNGSRHEEIEQARKSLAAAEAALRNSRLVFERQKKTCRQRVGGPAGFRHRAQPL